MISALILTKNEQSMIEDCLKQLTFVSEIIILDQYSQDNTVKIAKKYTDKIFKSDSEDFAHKRNYLAQLAHSDWVLYIDSDERLNKSNIEEIEQAIKDEKHVAYYFPRKNIILGKWLKHGGWWPDYVPRLFKRQKLQGWEGKVHESPKIQGEFGYFRSPIEHITARSLGQMLKKSINWAEFEANLYHRSQNPKVSASRVLKFSAREFLIRYFVKLGFLDGKVGFISSMYQAVHNAMILTYLWEIQNDSREKHQKATF